METTQTFASAPVMSAPPVQDSNTIVMPVRYGGFWRRVGAYFIDGIIVGAVVTIPAFMFGGLNAMSIRDLNDTNGLNALLRFELTLSSFGIILAWLYCAFMESSTRQATVGKMALGMKVTDLEGNRISFGRATGRFFGKIISAIIFYIGFIMVAFTPKKQGLHDMIAATLVVEAR